MDQEGLAHEATEAEEARVLQSTWEAQEGCGGVPAQTRGPENQGSPLPQAFHGLDNTHRHWGGWSFYSNSSALISSGGTLRKCPERMFASPRASLSLVKWAHGISHHSTDTKDQRLTGAGGTVRAE